MRIRLPGVVAARVVGRSRAPPHSRLERSPAVPRTSALTAGQAPPIVVLRGSEEGLRRAQVRARG